jgi:hypothetical protein
VEVEPQVQEVQLGQQVQGLVLQAEELQERPHQVHHHHLGKAQGQGNACRVAICIKVWHISKMSSVGRARREVRGVQQQGDKYWTVES